MHGSNYTGLEFLTALKNGEVPASPMAHTIPMKLIEVSIGKATYEVRPGPEHMNIQGGVHGGFYATVLDTVTGSAAHSLLDADVNYGTIDLNVKMIRPMQVNMIYYAQAELINAGRNIITTEGKIIDREGKVYAFASATLMVIHRK
ncbi:PaaI family thioesterase [Acinetobacter haemolyticus]|uniref:PaaI family thioesterase n=1 Tax=Acinetobacter haemolyticus TaxID=29430 RepID=UPI000D6992BD|nr:PaaI family thioesterase [Acinetobacter haemolyticus]